MRQAIMRSAQPAVTIPEPKKRIIRIEKPGIKLPADGTGSPVHISTLLDPIMEISGHPDRNRLLAEFFRK